MLLPGPQTALKTHWFTASNSFLMSSSLLRDAFVTRLAPAIFEKDCADCICCVGGHALICGYNCLHTFSAEAEDALRE